MKTNLDHSCGGTLQAFACVSAMLLVLTAGRLPAQTAIDETSPWPRVRPTQGKMVSLHLPQVESWTSNSFVARAPVEIKPAGGGTPLFGVVWFEAQGRVDREKRVVRLDRFEIIKSRFPEATDGGSNAVALVRDVLPVGARTVSLDYLITALGFNQAAARTGARGLKHDPPEIIWATNRSVLVLVDGDPELRPVAGTSLTRVINSPSLLVRSAQYNFYLAGGAWWFTAASLAGPWVMVPNPPPEVAALSPADATTNAPAAPGLLPSILVRTRPAELLRTSGMPDYRPVRGTALLYIANTDSQVFLHQEDRQVYYLISGRWFKSASLNGPWSYVPPAGLPSEFAKIPPGSPQGIVLASVPGTPQAELALLANSVPTTATVKRSAAKLEVAYDGPPQFKPIAGTTLSYAINAQLPVIKAGESYYAVDNAVWFVAAVPQGPWAVAVEVPEEIYSIPPESPVYYATFVHIYDADDETVETGYLPGYVGAYENDGTMVYGTGTDYEDWYGEEDYYGWGWSYGYTYYYVPWYGWWVWRPWWDESGGLWAGRIENIYDRWQARPGVEPHQRGEGAARLAANADNYAGFPALYGRFRGANRPAALVPPANTLAVNPYARPTAPVRAGETPRGAMSLATVRQNTGGGRDLYASPDGNVYLRKPDGWYRQQADGKFTRYAAAQTVANTRTTPAGAGTGAQVSPNLQRPASTGVNRGPGETYEARSRDVADLERQYYARTLAETRNRQVQPVRNVSRSAPAVSRSAPAVSRPARGGGGRR